MVGRTIIALAITVATAVPAGCVNSAETNELDPGDRDQSDDPPASGERCNNGFDDDENGLVDDGCACAVGDSQSCYPGDPRDFEIGACTAGTQTCAEGADGPLWGDCTDARLPGDEVCDGEDNDCNGTEDDLASGIACAVAIDLPGGDCRTLTCPPEQPHPIACIDLLFSGNDSKGCVAHDGGPEVFFKEGDRCSSGGETGSLICSQLPGTGLNATTCPHNRVNAFYTTSRNACPD